jgi:hypothetical protein
MNPTFGQIASDIRVAAYTDLHGHRVTCQAIDNSRSRLGKHVGMFMNRPI